MRLLLDTHVLMWSVARSRLLPPTTQALIADRRNIKLFSAASIWEIAIKASLGRRDFNVDPASFREAARIDFDELPITSQVAVKVAALPLHHRDPFDRLLVAQAAAEGARLLTADAALAAYGPPVLTLAAAAAGNLDP